MNFWAKRVPYGHSKSNIIFVSLILLVRSEMPGLKGPLSEEFIVESDSDPSAVHTKAAAKKPASILRKPNQSAKPRSDPSKKRKDGNPNASSTGFGVSYASVSNSRPNQAQDKSRSASHSRSSGSDEDEDESESDDSASDEELSRGASYVASAAVTMALLAPTMIDRP
ncbi:MAG: hypothetical protein L6R38_005208 [Xanthoria sp. 2 TBL-2021]|nr:MAG: hypothetical protein L6R38_005208 [Xanthoria sp. 2 TBL-2021]